MDVAKESSMPIIPLNFQNGGGPGCIMDIISRGKRYRGVSPPPELCPKRACFGDQVNSGPVVMVDKVTQAQIELTHSASSPKLKRKKHNGYGLHDSDDESESESQDAEGWSLEKKKRNTKSSVASSPPPPAPINAAQALFSRRRQSQPAAFRIAKVSATQSETHLYVHNTDHLTHSRNIVVLRV